MCDNKDTLIINAFEEYYVYMRENGSFYVLYGTDFYEKHAKLLPEFNINSGQKPIEELSQEEFNEFILNTIDYYGKSCIVYDDYKKLMI